MSRGYPLASIACRPPFHPTRRATLVVILPPPTHLIATIAVTAPKKSIEKRPLKSVAVRTIMIQAALNTLF